MPECLRLPGAEAERGTIVTTPTSARMEEACQDLVLSQAQIQEVYSSLLAQINLGLGRVTNQRATVKCFPTYVKELPNGHERGRFLALDLGGTNFRVLLIELDDGDFKMESRIFAVPHHIMTGSGKDLFDHIAECLSTFAHAQHIEHEVLPLGFTFSFPCSQHGLTEARLAQWTKGFSCSGVEGEDVVKLLEEAIQRRNDVQIKVCAVLNDTTGTLMSCAWKKHDTYVGLIIGTGTNACYVERLENVELWDGSWEEPKQVIVNTEWGAFGSKGELDHVLTEYDREIDQHSINPGRQVFEKMISGMYMGELVRLVLQRLTKKGLLFGGLGSEELAEKGSFYTKYVTEVESDAPGDYTNCRMVLEELGLDNATDEDCENVRYVCEVVSRRAAFLVGTGLAVLLNKMNRPSVTVGVDGSVYRYHPHVHRLMCEQINQLINPGIQFELMLSEDGSGRGAALVAAVASRTNS
ncbi:hexokinase type 2-like isoform X1 [Amphibalanus amphitrite]|uniref:hexokinase type 2-like isoform X1 n=2 Tax=Amphibalanus amphitrite TaxID=1232801 RepID=UPI001C901C1B|nr:hexokinase type 2-like isoform X1 [Amphibalanus amphitrite]